jgi:hypothetical protein
MSEKDCGPESFGSIKHLDGIIWGTSDFSAETAW